jgi:NitT/TauT family transport system substrate-binding protein
MGGPSIFAKLRNQGVPLKIVATTLTLSDLSVFARDPSVKSLTDLRGKQLAVDTGGSQYQIMSICARSKGLDLTKDVSLVDANFALSRAQLVAARVDAAMIPEPLATMLIEENPTFKAIFNGNAGWRALTGHDGWENVAAMREEAIKRMPSAPAQLIAALQETTTWIRGNLSSADQIVVDTVKLPPGVFKDAIASKRLDFNVQPAWGAQRAVISDMFRRAVAAGFGDKTPDDGIFYAP